GEHTGAVRFHARSLSPALCIGQALFQGLPFFTYLRVDHWYLGKTVIGVQTEGQKPVFDYILLSRPPMDVGPGKSERIDLPIGRHDRNEFWFRRGSRSRGSFPALLPPGSLFVSDISPPGAGKLLL